MRDHDGNLIAESDVHHVYEFKDGLISRMDVVEGGGHALRAPG